METVPPPETTRFFLSMLLNLIVKTHISYDKAFKIIAKRYHYRGWIVRVLYKIGYQFINYYYTLRWLAAKNNYTVKPGGIAAYYSSIGFSYRRALNIIQDEVKGLSKYKRISLLYSYPEYLVKDLLNHMDQQSLESMLRSLNTRRRWLRINTLRTNIEDALRCLEEENVVYKRSRKLPYMVEVEHPKWEPVSRIKCVRKGCVVPQDLSSALVVEALGPGEGWLLDACTAPGLKLSLAHMVSRNLYSIGVDVSGKRMTATSRILRLLGVDGEKYVLVVGDSRFIGFNRVFDYAIVDAPCSGLGAVYSDPAVKIAAGKKSKLEYYHDLQVGILRNVLRYARRVVYSTCSIHPLEGEAVIEKIVEEGLAEPVEPMIKLSRAYPGTRVSASTYRVYPYKSRSQGFYIAVLESRVAGR